MNCVVFCDGWALGVGGDWEFHSERVEYVVVWGTCFFGLLLLVGASVV